MTLKKLLLGALSLVALTYNAQTLPIARYNTIPLDLRASNTQIMCPNNISYSYHMFTARDCEKYLGRRKIISKGYQPVQITITNNSEHSFEFSLDSLNIPCIDYYEVIENVKFSTGKRVAAWGIPGIFIWPFLIPALIESVQAPKANRLLEIDFEKKALKSQTIAPHSSINGVVFFSTEQMKQNHYKKRSSRTLENTNLSLCLVDKTTNQKTIISNQPFVDIK